MHAQQGHGHRGRQALQTDAPVHLDHIHPAGLGRGQDEQGGGERFAVVPEEEGLGLERGLAGHLLALLADGAGRLAHACIQGLAAAGQAVQQGLEAPHPGFHVPQQAGVGMAPGPLQQDAQPGGRGNVVQEFGFAVGAHRFHQAAGQALVQADALGQPHRTRRLAGQGLQQGLQAAAQLPGHALQLGRVVVGR
ncbi:hypothetical protein [Ideonella sp. B508-1]|uniref:hypothetical protein n=1 Tax=Ideonella sp. B508-1 TaxID=137716 RepID=UPI0011D1A048|nr:hypothetical protein [Ideonella sp. B508-1]